MVLKFLYHLSEFLQLPNIIIIFLNPKFAFRQQCTRETGPISITRQFSTNKITSVEKLSASSKKPSSDKIKEVFLFSYATIQTTSTQPYTSLTKDSRIKMFIAGSSVSHMHANDLQVFGNSVPLLPSSLLQMISIFKLDATNIHGSINKQALPYQTNQKITFKNSFYSTDNIRTTRLS